MKESVCQEAHRLTTGARREKYHHPREDFATTAKIWSAVLRVPITADQVALCMIGLKLSRESRTHDRDNLVDMAGYAQTAEMLREEPTQ